MSLNDEQIKSLLGWFINESDFIREHGESRRKAIEENNQWIQPSAIKEMSDEELKNKYLNYFNSNVGDKQNLNRINRDRIIRDISKFRRTIYYLLNESIDVKERINEVLTGDYKIGGFGRGVLTAFLSDFNPEKYCGWNNKTEMGLKVLGWKTKKRGDSEGVQYVRVLELLKQLQGLRPDLNLSLDNVDAFLHTISAEEEGINKVKEIGGNGEMEHYWQIGCGENARLWDDLYANSIAAVGWNKLPNLEDKSKDEITELHKKYYPNCSEMESKLSVAQLSHFVNLKPGEKFVTNKGKKLLLAAGLVTSSYKFRPEREEYRHTVDVDYYKVSKHGEPIPDNLKGKFGKTIVPLTKEDFETLEALIQTDSKNAWIFQANPKLYDIENAIRGMTDILWLVKAYRDKIKRGDTVYLWKSGSDAGIIGVGTITSNPQFLENDEKGEEYVIQKDHFQKKEWRVKVHIDKVLEKTISRTDFQNDKTLAKCSILTAPQGTNFALTTEQASSIEKLINEVKIIKPVYTVEEFSQETGFPKEQIAEWQRILKRKQQIVFQGPPGTGKTFVAERLAKLLVSNTPGLIETVQFHPAYAYEDFIQGIRPEVIDGKLSYTLTPGRFLEFCERSNKTASGAPGVMIIDEINRANLARVFGELMFLLEYRDRQIPLAAGGIHFKIPENVYLIGTMNTADRSIALVDHALRRRFSFIRLNPDYDVLIKHLESHNHPTESLINVLREINKAIDDPNYEIGISFFMRNDNKLKEHLPDIWRGEIEPYLEEYFYDQPSKVNPYRWSALVENKLEEWSQ